MTVPKHQYLLLSIVFLIALLTRLSLGAESPHEVTETATQAGHPIEVSIGPDMAIKSGKFGTGFGASAGVVTTPLSGVPWYAGLDLGLNFWNYAQGSGFISRPGMVLLSEDVVGIQILPTTYYKIPVGPWYLHPFAGVSLGPTILVASGLPSSKTRVAFEVLFRPGVSFGPFGNLSVNVEPKLGFLDGDFIFQPVISAALAL